MVLTITQPEVYYQYFKETAAGDGMCTILIVFFFLHTLPEKVPSPVHDMSGIQVTE